MVDFTWELPSKPASTVFYLLKWTHPYLLIHPGKYCGSKIMTIPSLDREFPSQHRDQGFASDIQWFLIESVRKEILCNHKSTWICRLFLNYCYESSLIFFPRWNKYRLNLLCMWCIGGKRQTSFVVSLYCQAFIVSQIAYLDWFPYGIHHIFSHSPRLLAQSTIFPSKGQTTIC